MDLPHSITSAEHGDESTEPGHKPSHNKVSDANMHEVENRNEIEEEEEEYLSSSSSSSDTSSSDGDFFQLDPTELGLRPNDQSNNYMGTTEQGVTFSSNRAEKDASNKDELNSESAWPGKSSGSSLAPYPSAGVSGADSSIMFGTKQSPHVQVMGKSDAHDPNRIPSSIFTRTKSTTPMEWSVASNESLFSIHMGKSGDLTSFYANQFDNLPPIPPAHYPGPINSAVAEPNLQQQPPPQQQQQLQLEQQPQQENKYQKEAVEVANAETMKDFIKTTTSLQTEKPSTASIPHSDSTNRLSDSSANSHRSFAFPILTGDTRNPSLKTESMNEGMQKEQGQGQAQEQELEQEQEQAQAQVPAQAPAPALASAPPQPQPQQQPQTQPPQTQQPPLQTEIPKEVEPPAEQGGKWLPCFPCCSFCC